MLSLLGFPGTFGFIGKWYILSAVVAEGQVILPVILVLTSVVSAGYYLPVIMSMYMKPAPSGATYGGIRLTPTAAGIIALSIAVLLVFGFWPEQVLDLAGRTSEALTQTAMPLVGTRR
jgi:NADH-quinone oxidoreductase subunit N